MVSDDKRIKYSDSPFAPDWAKEKEALKAINLCLKDQ